MKVAPALLLVLLPTAAFSQGGTITVTSLADSGPGTLREAIGLAATDGGPTTITFDPALAGGVIHLASSFGPITHENQTTIDADLGADCVPDIGLDGSALSDGNPIVFWSSGNLVRGLAIYDFPGCGWGGEVIIKGAGATNNVVECNSIGLDLSGTPHPGVCIGMRISGGASDNRIERNQVTGAEISGIYLEDGRLPGYPDFAGLTPDLLQEVGTLDLTDDCESFKVRGGAPFLDTWGHPFTENFGLRLTGRIVISEEGDYTFELPGLDDLARLFVKDVTLVDWTGGGTPAPAVKHLEVGSHLFRLDYLEGSGAATLMLTASGPQPVAYSTDDNLGGCSFGHPNLCAELFQLRVPTERNRITRNSIWNNAGRGISLQGCGPVPNDPGDLDLGANTVLNTPVVQAIAFSGTPGSYLVSGSAPPNSVVELFSAWMDPTYTLGEGQELLGTLSADAGGSFSGAIPIPLWKNFMVATATDADGNTSEFSAPFLVTDNTDEVTVGAGSTLPDTVVAVPITVRDQSLTPLGRDRPVGERIQGLAFKVAWTPPSAVAAAHFERDGITASLTPDFENNTQAGNTASYVAFFVESTNPIPFTLDSADTAAKLVLTLAPGAAAGEIALTLDPLTTLENQAGTIEETAPLGTLSLVAGAVTVESNAAGHLLAMPESSSSIRLTWWDPNRNETGFRVERSPDGFSWAPVGTAGADDATFLDSGLPPATLFYYRLVTLVAGGDSQSSSTAAASTHAAVAAHICTRELSGPRTNIGQTTIARGAGEWAVAWADQADGRQSDLYFQRLAAADLSPAAPPVHVVATDAVSSTPVLYWNGTHYGLFWREDIRTEPGPNSLAMRHFFALLNPDGTKVRGDVPLPNAMGWSPFNMEHAYGWDGSHWGAFPAEFTTFPYTKLVYYRLAADGSLVLGPIDIATPTNSWVSDQAVAFAPGPGLWGVAWNQNPTWYGDSEVWFQRLEESTGAPVGPAVSLGTFSGPDQGVAIAWSPAIPPDGAWVVVWSQYAMDGSDSPLMLRRVAADGTVLGTAPTRLSDDFDPVSGVHDLLPILAVTGAGEVRAFATSVEPENEQYELGLLRADVDGNRIGSRSLLTPIDGMAAERAHLATNGDEQAVVFRDSTQGPMEVSALRINAAGAADPQVWLTAGHSQAASASIAPTGLAPLGSGYVTLWSDRLSSDPEAPMLAYARIVDGSGATIANLAPLAASSSWSLTALVAVGNEFATAWRPATGGIHFRRYDQVGNPIIGEATIAASGSPPTAIGFDGERYGVLFRRGSPDAWRFVPVAPDGAVLGGERVLFGPAASQSPMLFWVGGNWALVWRGSDSVLYYGVFDRDGNVVVPALPLTGPPANSARNLYSAAFDGHRILVAWSDHLGADPPATDVYFTILELDGTVVVPPSLAVGTAHRESTPKVIARDGTFHLFYSGEVESGVHKMEIQSDGTLLPGERIWTNRGSPMAVATNGASTALVWGQGELLLMTDACLVDTTPPSCPDLAIASADHKVRLTWFGGDDSDSGHWRTFLRRGDAAMPGSERALAELSSSTTEFNDGGFTPGTTHTYQVTAMNGAYMESEACPALAYSTWRGDANGNGTIEIGDIFYLINFMLAAGPPPAGDADANGSGGVTVGDIFYLINYFYGGGPPPVWSGETKRVEAPPALAERTLIASEESAESKRPASQLGMGTAKARPGASVTVPIVLFDASGTPLGEDGVAEARLQALAMGVRVLPASAVTRVEIRRAGMLAGLSPLFESTPTALDGAGLVVTFDEASTPLSWTTPRIRLRNGGVLVAQVVLTLADFAAATPGTRIELRFDPATTLLSNQAGTITESAANRWLRLVDGAVEVLP